MTKHEESPVSRRGSGGIGQIIWQTLGTFVLVLIVLVLTFNVYRAFTGDGIFAVLNQLPGMPVSGLLLLLAVSFGFALGRHPRR
jgi:hypothetical protein